MNADFVELRNAESQHAKQLRLERAAVSWKESGPEAGQSNSS